MNASRHIYERLMSYYWMLDVTHVNTSCQTYECVMPPTHECVMSHIWMRYECVRGHTHKHTRTCTQTHTHIYAHSFIANRLRRRNAAGGKGSGLPWGDHDENMLQSWVCVCARTCVCVYVKVDVSIYIHVHMFVNVHCMHVYPTFYLWGEGSELPWSHLWWRLQHAYCSTLQQLQHTATSCNALQRTHIDTEWYTLPSQVRVWGCNILQLYSAKCRVLYICPDVYKYRFMLIEVWYIILYIRTFWC